MQKYLSNNDGDTDYDCSPITPTDTDVIKFKRERRCDMKGEKNNKHSRNGNEKKT